MSSIKDYIHKKVVSNERLYSIFRKREHAALARAVARGKSIIGRHPLNVQIQTTSACNGKCVFCPYHGSWQNEHPGRMSQEVFEKIIQSLKGFTIGKFCPYLENEPLLDAALFDRLRYALDNLKPRLLEISSNFSVLKDDHLAAVEEMFPALPHEIWVSFHGASKESYEEIMGLSFERSLNNVLRLVELSQRVPLNVKIRGGGAPRKRMKAKSWFGEEEYREFWRKQLAPFSRKPGVVFFTYHDRAGSRQLSEKGMGLGVSRNSLEGFYCDRFDQWVHFLYTGEPILCCMDYNKETAFGASIERKSFEELFCSERYIELISKGAGLTDSEKDFICKRCISPGG